MRLWRIHPISSDYVPYAIITRHKGLCNISVKFLFARPAIADAYLKRPLAAFHNHRRATRTQTAVMSSRRNASRVFSAAARTC